MIAQSSNDDDAALVPPRHGRVGPGLGNSAIVVNAGGASGTI
jgi:hypothetical protein